MIKNYIKIGWRNLKRNKAYAFISVLGLALGIGCGILIFTLISYNLSFDNFHQNSNRIYRFYTEWHDESVIQSAGVPQPLAKAFRSDFTLAEKTARVINFRENLITIVSGKQIKKFHEENGVAFAEPDYFDILNFPLVEGNKKTALLQPNQAIVTEKIAHKYFGNYNPIGKVIRLDNKLDLTITGVLKDLPPNTDRRQEIYVSFASIENYINKNLELKWGWVNTGCQGFVLLKPNVTVQQVNNALAQIVRKHYTGRDLKIWNFKIQPLSDIHFNAGLGGYAEKKYLWALFFIGLFLIVTACVNFVNLATAQALNRSKEVGIRKVLGSQPSQLFWQFMVETALITFVAVGVAIGFAEVSLPFINNLFQARMEFNWEQLAAFIIGITILVIFLSGSYPGLVLARFQPIMALRNKLSQKHVGGFSLRRILVITQFSISQILIIGTIIVVLQIHYSQNADLGFDKNAVVLLPVPASDKAKLNTVYSRLNELSGVENVSYCFMPPASEASSITGVNYNHRSEDEHWNINVKPADDHYLSTFGIKLIAGRNFYPADSSREFLVNETFVRKLNLRPNDVIGKTLAVNDKQTIATIVGVVKDFHNYSFHQEIDPVCMGPDYKTYSTCAVKINMGNARPLLSSFEKIWSDAFPDQIYSYQFMDDKIARFYQFDSILLKLIEVFSGIAIIIGCLGLYGLVSFMAVRKTKEIGVRKVLGASLKQILWIFGREFCTLLLIAFTIAAPLAWWVMNNYLHDFKYRIAIGPGIFFIAILSTFLIASFSVGYKSIIAALANPVKSLKSE